MHSLLGLVIGRWKVCLSAKQSPRTIGGRLADEQQAVEKASRADGEGAMDGMP